MAVAIIAALGTALVTLLGFFTQRIQARDSRVKLEKDLELLKRLDSDSLEYQWLKSHIQRSIFIFVENEQTMRAISLGIPAGLLTTSVVSYFWILLPINNDEVGTSQTFYWIAFGFTLLLYLSGVVALLLWRFRRRYILKMKSAEKSLDAELADFELNKTVEPAVSESWVTRFWQWLASAIRGSQQSQLQPHQLQGGND